MLWLILSQKAIPIWNAHFIMYRILSSMAHCARKCLRNTIHVSLFTNQTTSSGNASGLSESDSLEIVVFGAFATLF
jgi:hypothetical protein